MAQLFDANNANITGPNARFKLKQLLVSAGWTVPSSGDGLSAFSSSSDVISSGSSGANGMANTNAWVRLKMPSANGVNREILIQYGGGTTWTIKYSYSAGFTGGSPSATVAPTAADSKTLSFSNIPTDNTFRWNAMADSSAPYGFWSGGWPSGGGTGDHAFVFDPLTLTDSLDIDPYAFYLSTSASSFRASDMTAGIQCFFRKGLSNEVFSLTSNACRWTKANTSTVVFPGAVGTNPHTGNDDSIAIICAISPNGSGAFPGGYKGYFSFLRWNGNSARVSGDTLSVSSSNDRVCISDCNLPWNASTPTL